MKKVFIVAFILFTSLRAISQVEVTNGPNLKNDVDLRMNRMLGGDDNSFYCFRIRDEDGRLNVIEKYDKNTLMPTFSVEFTLEGGRFTKVEDVHYAANTVYIFIRSYVKKTDEATLYYLTVSDKGVLSKNKTELLKTTTDHFEFVDYEIHLNPSKTKFLLKAFHKADRQDQYVTDFILYDAQDLKKIWAKNLGSKIGNETLQAQMASEIGFSYGINNLIMPDIDTGFIGLFLDDKDNIYFATSNYTKKTKTNEKQYKINIFLLKSGANETLTTELALDEGYKVQDIKFSLTPDNNLVVGGFLKDILERKGKDIVKVGIFTFTLNTNSGEIISKTVKIFDYQTLVSLESNAEKSKSYKYKLDYIIAFGNDVYYVGEQYSERKKERGGNGATIGGFSTSGGGRIFYIYEYMDVIVAKLNANGEFEWIKNTPLRNHLELEDFPHVFKQYIAVVTSKAIYILNNEAEKNMEIYGKPDYDPKDLKNCDVIHGTNFVYSAVDLKDGNIDHGLVFFNKDYCFAPTQERNINLIPPSNTEIFIPGKENSIYIYTENRGKDRFSKITFE